MSLLLFPCSSKHAPPRHVALWASRSLLQVRTFLRSFGGPTALRLHRIGCARPRPSLAQCLFHRASSQAAILPSSYTSTTRLSRGLPAPSEAEETENRNPNTQASSHSPAPPSSRCIVLLSGRSGQVTTPASETQRGPPAAATSTSSQATPASTTTAPPMSL